ncbi:MAG: Crp/Fnr family transcriptional regulator [Pedobacter sp.]|nr:MAG: Crp/Fnr family transcriptional regulator [Pedobacter sp.]
MPRKNLIKPIDEATAYLWKTEVIDSLNVLGGIPVAQPMEDDLRSRLKAHAKLKGHFLLEPDMKHSEASYLRSGIVKLFVLDKRGRVQNMHVWVPGEIIVLFKYFKKRLLNTRYYLSVIANAEMVSISIDSMDFIYATYPAHAYMLTTEVLAEKSDKRMKLLEIVGSLDKEARPAMFDELFPELRNKLNNGERIALLGIGESTLGRSNR